jgi:hypothetical protein
VKARRDICEQDTLNACGIPGLTSLKKTKTKKLQGYRSFLRKMAGSSFGQKKGNLCCTRKNIKNEKN